MNDLVVVLLISITLIVGGSLKILFGGSGYAWGMFEVSAWVDSLPPLGAFKRVIKAIKLYDKYVNKDGNNDAEASRSEQTIDSLGDIERSADWKDYTGTK